MVPFCPSSASVLLFTDPCVREAWAALLPTLLVLILVFVKLVSASLNRFVGARWKEWKSPLAPFLTLEEAEELDFDESDENGEKIPQQQNEVDATRGRTAIRWLTLTFAIFSLLESGVWLALGSYLLSVHPHNAPGLLPFFFAFTWIYALFASLTADWKSPPYRLFMLFVFHFVGAVLLLGGVFYERSSYGAATPPKLELVGLVLNIVVTAVGTSLILSRPFAVRSAREERLAKEGRRVSPEDYTSLFSWAVFRWINPLVGKGTRETLNEDDVWELSVTMRARPVFRKFETIKGGLLWRLWKANSQDFLFDFVGTMVSVFFNYSGPFFLKRIIDAIDSRDAESVNRAYFFAILMFVCQIAKSEADLQHLWYGRRASVRVASQLRSAIYDKALRRRDFSGIVNKDKKEEKDGDKKKKEDENAGGADVGKIVNLMAGDVNRMSMIVSGMYFIYGAPFELFIASLFLYQLLGLSAFAGFLVLLLGWPLNSLITRRSVRIQRGLLAARDIRMNLLNELLGALKFVKFFAWEERWQSRVSDARKTEIDWLIKNRLNNIMLQSLWALAPILISVISFMTYVLQGNRLTVGTAFTAIALFNMVRAPLNVVPTWIVMVLQTKVALKRIEKYLAEDEVDGQVSSIKEWPKDLGDDFDPSEFGFRDASFKWNSVDEKKEGDEDGKKDDRKKSNGPQSTDIEAAINETMQTSISEAGTDAVESQDRVFELRDLNVIFPEGSLTLVTGPTASGKTALLLALLGEMTKTSGTILMKKDPTRLFAELGLTQSISYAAQAPWLQHQSIRENILFSSPYNEQRYKAVLKACALLPDLEILEDGDETEIGARGVSLSGGQKARVALARAVYKASRWVILDDPLSAVDSHTARYLYENLFLGPLMKGRTVILVTHHVELMLPGADYLVRMLDGRIDLQGRVKELRANGQLNDVELEGTVEERAHLEEEKEEEAIEDAPEKDGADAGERPDAQGAKKGKKPRKLVKDEEREAGSVKWVIYKTYLKASSYWTWAVLLFLVVCTQLLAFVEKYWIKVWGEAYGNDPSTSIFSNLFSSNTIIEQQTHSAGSTIGPHHFSSHHFSSLSFVTTGIRDRLPSPDDSPLFYVGIYALIGVVTVIISITSSATTYTGALHASRALFRSLLQNVVFATMRWFDVTPTGRIMNRFQKDIETIDTTLAGSMQLVNSSLASFLTSMVVVIAVFPPFVIPGVVIGYCYYKLGIAYLNTGRDLRRMESTTRSPIFSGFGELLEGIVTVRAFSAERRFMNNLYTKVDLTLRMFYMFWMTNRWLLFRFDFLSGLAVFITTIFALLTSSGKSGKSMEGWAGWAALCITSAMSFTNNIYWACRFWTQLELDLNSIERVVEYLSLPQEPPAVIENARPPAHWPSSSGPNEDKLLEVRDLEIRYSPELPAVLHSVSFSVKARERIGLLGRTGSGKSTLAMSILRFVDPTKGEIRIDGIDITSIGVKDLRERVTFIPQDATLFSGTVRDNLDPFGEHEDSELWDALERVHLISSSSRIGSAGASQRSSRAPSIHEDSREETDDSAIRGREEGSGERSTSRAPSESTAVSDGDDKSTTSVKITLSTDVSAGGLNFSAGQRQLLAMARALLRQSAVVVLDEATSSIDFATDSKIQKTIREEFNNSLLLTIAHRLRTVIDYDRLIVLDAGRIVEFDTPYSLIQKQDGIFRGMCLKSGNFTELEGVAKSKAERDGVI